LEYLIGMLTIRGDSDAETTYESLWRVRIWAGACDYRTACSLCGMWGESYCIRIRM
jgi:hypothetical protein